MMIDRNLRRTQKRTTWTSFHLPSTQPWPTWPSASIPEGDRDPDPYLGILSNVSGVENVRLARRVEDVEQAAYVVLEFDCPITVSGMPFSNVNVTSSGPTSIIIHPSVDVPPSPRLRPRLQR